MINFFNNEYNNGEIITMVPVRVSIFICFVTLAVILTSFSGCIQPETEMIPMRDGVKLATDVYLPESNQPHGSLLIRTPYNKNDNKMTGIDLASAGWPTVIQDMRGRYASEGIDTVFFNAHTDGPDTLAWIAEQEWSNGKIVSFGGSALGINQYYMAGTNPEHLACQFIQVATPDLYHHAMYQGGQFRKSLVELWLQGQGSLYILEDFYQHENYTLNDYYWTNVSLEDNWEDVNVPAIHFGGWYDCFSQGTVEGFKGYQYLGGAGARGNSKLIMGPWTHSGGQFQGELTYPENAIDNFSYYMFEDMVVQYTMDGPNDFDDWPAVIYYVMGDVENTSAPGNIWLTSDQWPIPYQELPVYCHSAGSLSTEIQSTIDTLTYTYDPTNPVSTYGGQNLNILRGPYDQQEIEQREDVLVFTSPILTEPLWITGPITVRLYVSSTGPDTDFTAKLCDVYPDGRSMLINDGILRMRNRNGCDHWEFMEPGTIYEIEIQLWDTSYVFNRGHQLRISISSSNYPRFLANPNTKEPMAHNTSYAIAENSIYIGPDYPSCIILPQVIQNYELQKEKAKNTIIPLIENHQKKNTAFSRGNQVLNLIKYVRSQIP